MILIPLVLITYSGVQHRAQDVNLETQAHSVETKAEAYYAMTNDYPKSLSDFEKYKESTIPSDVDVNGSMYTNTAVTYVYCGPGAAQVVYLGKTTDDKVITALGTASETEECPSSL